MALGQVEQGLGDYDAAFDHYERGYEARDFLMTVMNTDPQFRLVPPWKTSAIQDDPRWINIVRRVGLSF
jgi:hypothetical protein